MGPPPAVFPFHPFGISLVWRLVEPLVALSRLAVSPVSWVLHRFLSDGPSSMEFASSVASATRWAGTT